MANSMKSEAARLSTYKNWPRDKLVSPLALAGAGFYYLGVEDRVKCYSCHGTVMCWENGDIPLEEHRKHFPQCPFLRNPRQAGNVLYFDDYEEDNAVLGMQSDSAYGGLTQSDSAQPGTCQNPVENRHNLKSDKESMKHMKDETQRLQSLQSWPKRYIIDITKVAKAGLYFTGQEDKLQCAFCAGSMVNWAEGDDPAVEHKKHFGQRCPFLKSSLETLSNTQNDISSQLQRLNIIADRPKLPDMANFERRCASFRNWPSEHIQKGENLAIAGFFYTGTSDQVRCFFCNVGLSNWDRSDDPWQEHAKWSPKCGYLGLNPAATETDQEETDNVPTTCTLEEENRRLKEERLCKMCRNRDSQVVFLPCGHIVTCDQCAPRVKRCLKESCKKSVEGTVRAFMA